MGLVPVPSLAELVDNPGRLTGLPREAVLEVLRAARLLVVEAEHALALSEAVPAPQGPQDGHKDRRLTPKEAAAYLGQSLRYLRYHQHEIPGRIRLSYKTVVYSEQALAKFLRQRTTDK